MNKKILEKVLSGLSDKNVRFNELKKLVGEWKSKTLSGETGETSDLEI